MLMMVRRQVSWAVQALTHDINICPLYSFDRSFGMIGHKCQVPSPQTIPFGRRERGTISFRVGIPVRLSRPAPSTSHVIEHLHYTYYYPILPFER